ncbi:hypothetical protein D3C77_587240 [compost metagenome]
MQQFAVAQQQKHRGGQQARQDETKQRRQADGIGDGGAGHRDGDQAVQGHLGEEAFRRGQHDGGEAQGHAGRGGAQHEHAYPIGIGLPLGAGAFEGAYLQQAQ